MFSPCIQKLIEIFSKFPTIGPRTAARFVFYLIKEPNGKVKELIKSISDLKEKIKICPICFNSFEPKFESEKKEKEICPLCVDKGRDKDVICIVAREMDLEAIEKTKRYKGLYFVLNGTIPNVSDNKEKKEEMEQKVDALIERIKNSEPKIKEIILALNPTPEGENTSLWLQRKFKPLIHSKEGEEGEGARIVQLGRGLPLGGELEYADEETLSSALENRK